MQASHWLLGRVIVLRQASTDGSNRHPPTGSTHQFRLAKALEQSLPDRVAKADRAAAHSKPGETLEGAVWVYNAASPPMAIIDVAMRIAKTRANICDLSILEYSLWKTMNVTTEGSLRESEDD